MVEEIAKADGSTAWCLNQASVLATHSAFLSKEVSNLIWGHDPRGILANGPSPSAKAVVVDGGYRVTGQWAFSSGCSHATWVAGLGAVIENGEQKTLPNGSPEFRYMLMPKSEAEFTDIWHVKGLRGTGSQHFAVTDHFVPTERTVWTVADPVVEPGPLYLFPMFLMFACGFASVALGVARSALDAMLELAGSKKQRGESDVIRDRGMVQFHVGQAEATWRAARAFLHETVREVWNGVVEAHEITLEQRVLLRMATTHTIRQAAQTVDIAYNTSGVSVIYDDSPMQRNFQDIHVITQHIQGRLSHYELVGQYYLGLDPSGPWL